MANTTPAKYTVQLGPTVTPEVAANLAAAAELLGVSNSQYTRDAIERGLARLAPALRKGLAERYGAEADEVWEKVYAEHLRHFQGRGARQTTRRRQYDRESRSTSSAA